MNLLTTTIASRRRAYFFLSVLTALPLTALAADISMTPPAGGGFVVKDAGGNERFRVQGSGDVRVPGLPAAAAAGSPTCFDANTGRLGPCAAGAGSGPTGQVGPAGPAGAIGPIGPVGPTGLAGASGPAGPAGATGPQGLSGPPGPPGIDGPAGPAGAMGRTILSGTGTPAAAIGSDGDFYIDTSANKLFGPKGASTAGQWAATATALVGPAGNTGPAGSSGPAGANGPAGLTGPPGATGPAGAQGASGPAGSAGPAGPVGPAGPQGPAGPTGGGARLVDANNLTLGKVVTATRSNVTIVTSTGYLTIVNWAGTFPAAQIYYTTYDSGTGVCGGTAYLNSGGSSSGPSQYMYARNLVWSASLNTLMAAVAPLADGTAATTSPATGVIQGIDNPACSSSSSTNQMWQLAPVSRNAAGLPATIAAPLSIQ